MPYCVRRRQKSLRDRLKPILGAACSKKGWRVQVVEKAEVIEQSLVIEGLIQDGSFSSLPFRKMRK